MMKFKFKLVAALIALTLSQARAGEVIVIAHPSVGRIDILTVQRIFTGKIIETAGVPVVAVNLSAGALRERFLHRFLNQDDDKYTAYWTVRRFIGKGTPPREVSNAAEVINFVQTTPGAIGYIDESEIRPGLNVVAR